ncbi:ubiquitin-protein transferase [Aureococcus anophagefferens]|nr:ubiquitin-protein transferase [Aureococcus anophagefferens]
MVKAHPDGTIVVESTGNLCDFFLLRPKELSAEEALELAKRKELAKYGQKRRPSDAPEEDKTRLTVTSNGCDEYYGVRLSEKPEATVRVTVSARSPLVEVRPCEFRVEPDKWRELVQVAVLSVTESHDDPRAAENTATVAIQHYCHSVDVRFNKVMPTLLVNFVESTSKSLIAFGAGGSGQRGERGPATSDNCYQMRFPKHCDDAMARMAGVAQQLVKLASPAEFGRKNRGQRPTAVAAAVAKTFGFAGDASSEPSNAPAEEAAPKVDEGYPMWYDLSESVADNISSDSDIAPDRDAVRRCACGLNENGQLGLGREGGSVNGLELVKFELPPRHVSAELADDASTVSESVVEQPVFESAFDRRRSSLRRSSAASTAVDAAELAAKLKAKLAEDERGEAGLGDARRGSTGDVDHSKAAARRASYIVDRRGKSAAEIEELEARILGRDDDDEKQETHEDHLAFTREEFLPRFRRPPVALQAPAGQGAPGAGGAAVLLVDCGSLFTVAFGEVTETMANGAEVTENRLFSWGNNRGGALGLGHQLRRVHGAATVSVVEDPTEVEDMRGVDFQQVSCGGFHSALLDVAGRVLTCGEIAQVGRKGVTDAFAAVRLPRRRKLDGARTRGTVLECGGSHTVVLTSTKEVFTFGDNSYGQLGIGSKAARARVEIDHWFGWS